MDASKYVTIKKRALGILLSIVMIIASIPSSLIPALSVTAAGPWDFGPGGFGGFGGWGPNVLTNVSVSFYDGKFKPITEAESGTMFYMSVQLSGNNVNDPVGTDHFRLEITDNNLLLPNFAGDGFVDGAEYNGFTLHVEEGKRYLEYSIRNGSTKMIRLQAKFANGKTPDGTSETIKLIQTTSGKSVSNTITADSDFSWGQSKTESTSRTDTNALADGVKVDYTLSANSNNAGKKTGAWWAESLTFDDTLTMPAGVSADLTEAQLKAAIEAAGFYDYTINDFSNSGAAVHVNFTINSKDANKEMDNVKINLPVTFSGTDVDGGAIENNLKVNGNPIGSDKSEPLGDDTVKVDVVKVEPPEPEVPTARFRISKSVDKENISLTKDGEFSEDVVYTIVVENYGDAEGTVTLVEEEGNGIELDEGKFEKQEITLMPNEKKEIIVKGTVNGTMTNGQSSSFTNHVYDENNPGNGAYAQTTVGKKQSTVNIDKSGYVNKMDNKWFGSTDPANPDKVTYELEFENYGSEQQTVEYKDVLEDISADAIEWDEDSKALLSGTITLPPADYSDPSEPHKKTITLTGTIKSDFTGDKIVNKLETSVGSKTETFEREKAVLGITKSVDGNVQSFLPGDSVTFKIEVKNTGTLDAKDVKIMDAALGTTFADWTVGKITADLNGKAVDTPPTAEQLTNGFNVDIPANGSYIISIPVTAPADLTAETVSNQASYSYGEAVNIPSNTVELKKQEYTVEKTIVDEKEEGYTVGKPGETVVFEVKFTNTSGKTIEDLVLSDYSTGLNLKVKDGSVAKSPFENNDFVSLKITQSDSLREDGKYDSGQEIPFSKTSGTYTDWEKGYILHNYNTYAYMEWCYRFVGVNLPNNGSITIQYEATVDENTGYQVIQDDSRPANGIGITALATGEAWYNSHWKGQAVIDTVAVNVNNSISYQKSTDKTSVSVSNEEELNDVINNGIDYTFTLIANQEDKSDYTNHKFVITDVLPDGIAYKPNSIRVTNQESEKRVKIDDAQYDPKTNTLTVTLTATGGLSGNGVPSQYIAYTGLISEELAKELKEIPRNDTKLLTNKITQVKISGNNVNKTLTTVSEAVTEFNNLAPKPGFAKSGVASLPGEFDARVLISTERSMDLSQQAIILYGIWLSTTAADRMRI